MKKIFILILIVTALISIEANQFEKEEYYLSGLSYMLNRYEIFMEKNANKDSAYYKAYLLFKDKLQKNETIFKLDLENSNLIDDGARFYRNNETEEYYIGVGYKLVDIFNNYPTLVFSILTHEIWHAYAYLTNPEGFLMIDTDPFEKQMYEFDAIINEAIFIDEAVFKSDYIPSNFEGFLRDCYINQSFSDFTSSLMKVDYYVLYELYNLRNEYLSSKDVNYLKKDLVEIGTSLNSYYEESLESDNLWYTYNIMVALNTYVNYSTILLRQTISHLEKYNIWEDIYKDIPEFQKLYYQFSQIIEENIEFIDSEHREYIKQFNMNLL